MIVDYVRKDNNDKPLLYGQGMDYSVKPGVGGLGVGGVGAAVGVNGVGVAGNASGAGSNGNANSNNSNSYANNGAAPMNVGASNPVAVGSATGAGAANPNAGLMAMYGITDKEDVNVKKTAPAPALAPAPASATTTRPINVVEENKGRGKVIVEKRSTGVPVADTSVGSSQSVV